MTGDEPSNEIPTVDPTRLLESMNDGVYYVDRQRKILYFNEGAERISGVDRGEVIGRHCYDDMLGHVNEQGQSVCQGDCPLSQVMRDGQRREERLFLHHKNGHRVAVSMRVSPVHAPDGSIIGAVESFSDDTWREDVHHRVAELERLALLDPLTGLLNRRGLEQAIEARWDERRRYGWPFGVLVIDLDEFKGINDRHGHETGDEILRMVARSLTAGARAFDAVGRWGGEEFVVAVTNVDPAMLLSTGERLCRLVETSELRDIQGTRVTCSIGAASIRDGETTADLLQRADTLMYQAKREGGNRVRI